LRFPHYFACKFTSLKGEGQPSKIVILNTTSCCDDDYMPDENGRPVTWEKTAESLRQKSPSLQQTTIDGFRRANAKQAFLASAFRFPVKYEITDSAQLKSILKGTDGDCFAYYKQYPGAQGIATISRVGFSVDGTQALFYISNVCGGLCGGGSYVVMEKRDGRWMISKEIEKWIS
jgi:hypothetical protein